jgi:hypothetical protein
MLAGRGALRRRDGGSGAQHTFTSFLRSLCISGSRASHARMLASTQAASGCEELQGMEFDFVVTVCDKARETCRLFPTTTCINCAACRRIGCWTATSSPRS